MIEDRKIRMSVISLLAHLHTENIDFDVFNIFVNKKGIGYQYRICDNQIDRLFGKSSDENSFELTFDFKISGEVKRFRANGYSEYELILYITEILKPAFRVFNLNMCAIRMNEEGIYNVYENNFIEYCQSIERL